MQNKIVNGVEFTPISNGRHVVHFLAVLTAEEKQTDLFGHYETALAKAKKIGGRRFHNKQYGGGIAFYASDLEWLSNQILQLSK